MPRNITVTFEDGSTHVYQGAPDDVTPDQVSQRAAQEFGKGVSALDGGRKSLGMVGDLAAGAVRGAGSIGATILAPIDIAKDAMAGKGLSLESNRERRKAMDEALGMMGADTDSLAYKGGRLAGEIAGTAGAGGAIAQGARAIAPGLSSIPTISNALRAVETAGAQGGNLLSRSAGGAVTGAVSAGMVNPEDATGGAIIGGAAPGVLGLVGKAGSAVGNMLRPKPQNAKLADAAINKYGIPLGAADVSSSPVTRAVRSVLNDAPLGPGAIGAAQKESVQQGLNKAVGGTFGAPAPKLTADVMDQAKKRLGAEFDRIWGGNSLQVDGTLMQKLGDLDTAAAKLPRNEGGSLKAEIQDLLSKVQTDASGNTIIPGDVANKFQSYLRRRAEGSAGLKNELGDLRQAIIGAFNRSVSPSDAAALTANRSAYKAFKTIEPILNSAEVGVAGRAAGDVPAALLPGAVLKSYGNAAGTDLGELSQIASQFIADRVARTGGSTRAMVQNSMLGGALGAGAITNPLLAATAIPMAAGTNALLGSPGLARMMLPNGQPGPVNALGKSVVYRTLPLLAADR